MRLDIPAGTAVRFEPGETKTVTLVEIAGEKLIRGGNNLVDGPATPGWRTPRPNPRQRVAAANVAHATTADNPAMITT